MKTQMAATRTGLIITGPAWAQILGFFYVELKADGCFLKTFFPWHLRGLIRGKVRKIF